MMQEIKNREELDNILSTSSNVILKVGTGSCGPCQLMENRLEDIEVEFPGYVFLKVDAEEADESFINELNIRNVPVIIKYVNGKIMGRLQGVSVVEDLINFVR